jgi:hypothetical protein
MQQFIYYTTGNVILIAKLINLLEFVSQYSTFNATLCINISLGSVMCKND